MGIVSSILNGLIDTLQTVTKLIIETLIVNPLKLFVGGLMGFLQDVIIGTPYPKATEGKAFPAVTSEPAGSLWQTLYGFHNDTFQPLAYFLLFMSIVIIIFFDVVDSGIPDGSPIGASINDSISNAKSKLFIGFILVTFWWYLGTFVLATSDALANLIIGTVGDGESKGLVHIWNVVVDELAFTAPQLLIPLAVLWLLQAIVLAIIALLWVLRLIAIYILMPIMPVMIAIWVMDIPGLDDISDVGKNSVDWFITLSFMTLPAALVIGVSAQMIDAIMNASNSMMSSGSSTSALSGYDTTELISHPTVGGKVYGDGVAGLSATTQPHAMGDVVAGFGMMLFAVLISAGVPIIAGLAPFYMFRDEAQVAARAAAGDPTAVQDGLGKIGDMKDSVESGYTNARTAAASFRGDYETVAEMQGIDDDVDEYTRDAVMNQMTNSDDSMSDWGTISAGLGGQGSDAVDRTQQTASEIRSGAATARDYGVKGVTRLDNAQHMLRDEDIRGQLGQIGRRNIREGGKRIIDPRKQQARLYNVGESVQSGVQRGVHGATNPRETVNAFEESVVDQAQNVHSRLENEYDDTVGESLRSRRKRLNKLEDKSEAHWRQKFETQGYVADEEDARKVAEYDSSIVTNEELEAYDNEFNRIASYAKAAEDDPNVDMLDVIDEAEGTVEETIGQIEGVDEQSYKDLLSMTKQQYEMGAIDEDTVAQRIRHMSETLQEDAVMEDEFVSDYEKRKENYEKFGASFEDEEEFLAQSLSKEDIESMDSLEDIYGGYQVDEDSAERALQMSDSKFETVEEFLEADGTPDSLDELQENPLSLAETVGVEAFNEAKVADGFKAKETVDNVGFLEDEDIFGENVTELEGLSREQFETVIQKSKESDLKIGAARNIMNETYMELAEASADEVSSQVTEELVKGELQKANAEGIASQLQELEEKRADFEINQILEDGAAKGVEAGQLGIEEALENYVDEEAIEEQRDAIQSHIKENVEGREGELGEYKTDTGLEMLVDSSVSTNEIEAEEDVGLEMLHEMVENAESEEAAQMLIDERRQLLAEEADMVPGDMDRAQALEEEERQELQEDIVGDLVEQSLSGGELDSEVSRRFHQKYESTEEMLENITEVQEAREIVKEMGGELENVEQTATVTGKDGSEVSLSKLQSDDEKERKQALEKVVGEGYGDISDGNIDSDTLREFLGVDSNDSLQDELNIDEVDRMLTDDDTKLINSKVQEKAVERVEKQVQSELNASSVAEAKKRLGVDEINEDNLDEVLQKTAVEKAKEEYAEEYKKKATTEE